MKWTGFSFIEFSGRMAQMKQIHDSQWKIRNSFAHRRRVSGAAASMECCIFQIIKFSIAKYANRDHKHTHSQRTARILFHFPCILYDSYANVYPHQLQPLALLPHYPPTRACAYMFAVHVPLSCSLFPFSILWTCARQFFASHSVKRTARAFFIHSFIITYSWVALF